MKISQHSVSALGTIITGDAKLSPYRSGPDLVSFFNQFVSNESYGRGFPSRWVFCELRIDEVNGTDYLKGVIEAALDPRLFLGTEFKIELVAEHLNQYLEYDGYKVSQEGKIWKVVPLNVVGIDLKHPFADSSEVTHVFIGEQIDKCTRKLEAEDYDGAITNSRSLLEAVLVTIERYFDPSPQPYDGNLPKLYKKVQVHLNLIPGQENLADTLRQILSGLTSVVNGLAGLRNSMSDSHVINYRPSQHHARLAVNACKTLCNFLFDTYQFQKEKKAT